MLPTIVLAQVSHHAIPSIVHAQRSLDKSKLHNLHKWGTSTSFVYYLILGIIVPLWTGFNTEEIVTSNWICFDEPCVVSYSTYVECLFLLISNCCAVCRVFDVLVRYPVIVLPIAIALSSFPLEVITMSDNVKLMFSARSARAAIDEQVTWKERGFRCLFVIIPLIFALFLFDFNTAVSYTSLFGDYLTLRLRGM